MTVVSNSSNAILRLWKSCERIYHRQLVSLIPSTISLLSSHPSTRRHSRYYTLHCYDHIFLLCLYSWEQRWTDQTLNALRTCCRVCGWTSGFGSRIHVVISSTKRHTGVVFLSKELALYRTKWQAGDMKLYRTYWLVKSSALGLCSMLPLSDAIGDLVEWPSYLHMSSYGIHRWKIPMREMQP